jgi:aminocarboxymuconate-semialdehyde decarboxylase
VLDRFPNIKVVAAHGGGFLPSYVSRSDHGYEVRAECRRIKHAPSWYLRNRLWFDNLMHRPESLAHLLREVGASQVVLGTDYPYDMGQDGPIAIVEALGLPAEDKARIKGGNAAHLLSL